MSRRGFLIRPSALLIDKEEIMDESANDAIEWLTPEEAAELQDSAREEYAQAFEILKDN